MQFTTISMLIAAAASGAAAIAKCDDTKTEIQPPIAGTNCPSVGNAAIGYKGQVADCGVVNGTWTGSNPLLSKVGHYTFENTGDAAVRVLWEINTSYSNGITGFWVELAAGESCEGDTYSDNYVGLMNYQTTW